MGKINFNGLVENILLENFGNNQRFSAVLLTALTTLGDPNPDKNVILYAQEALNMFLQKGGQSYISDERLLTERTAWPVIDIITFMLQNFYSKYTEGPILKKRQFEKKDLDITAETIKNTLNNEPEVVENIINTITAFSTAPRNYIIQHSQRLKKLDSDIDIRSQKIEQYLNDTPLGGILNYYKNIKSKYQNEVATIMSFPLDYAQQEVNSDLQSVKNLSQTLLEFYRQNLIRVYGDVYKVKQESNEDTSLPNENEFVDILKRTAGTKRFANEKFHLDYIQFLNGNSEFLVNIDDPSKFNEVDKVLTKLGVTGYEPLEGAERVQYPPPYIKQIKDFNIKTFLVGATKVYEAYLIAIDVIKGPKTRNWSNIVKQTTNVLSLGNVMMGPVN